MPLSLGHSAWLLALAASAAGALTWWAYRHPTPPLSGGRRALLGGLRFLALAIVLFLLFEPVWRQISEAETPPAVAVLLDESESLRVTAAAGSTAGGASAEALPEAGAPADTTGDPRPAVRRALAQLEGSDLSNARLHFFGFSNAARRLPGGASEALDALRFDGSRTDLTAALQSAREQLEGQNLRAIVLASDGQYNSGKNPLYWADRAPVPVHTVVLGDTTRQRDVVLRRAEANDLSYVDTAVPVRALVQAEGFGGQAVQVSLWDGQQRLDTARLTLPEGTAERAATLTFTPEEAGLKRLTASVARLDGEATYRNNTQSVALRVLEQKRQVLLLGAAPSPDFASTRRLLEQDPTAEVTALIPKQPGGFYGGTLPDSLSSFDVVVLAGFPGTAVAPQTARRVAQAISAEGLPALFLLGRQTDLQALQAYFGEALPAVPEQVRSSSVEALFVPTAAGQRHPVLDLPQATAPTAGPVDTSSAGNAPPGGAGSGVWTRLPPLRKSQTRWQTAPDARTLATAQVRGVDTGEALLLVQRRAGQRAAMLLGTGTWRWANLPEALSGAASRWPALLANLVQWTSAAENDRPVRVEPVQPTFAGGDAVRLTGQVYDESLQPVDGASVEITLSSPDGKRYPLQMQGQGQGRYVLEAPALPPGRYDYEATAQKNGQTLGTDQGTFAVGSTTFEYRHTRANAALMRQIAQRSGGSFHAADDPGTLPRQIAEAGLEPLVMRTPQETQLWQRYGFLVAALLLLGAEWILRRRSGMA